MDIRNQPKGLCMNYPGYRYDNSNNLTVTPKELFEYGLDPAVAWNIDRNKRIKSHIFIVTSLINGYSKNVIATLVGYFGEETVILSLEKHRSRISNKLFDTVKDYIKHPEH